MDVLNTGNIVATYVFEKATVRIGDASFACKTPEQIERDKLYARRVACGIVRRAMERGATAAASDDGA